MRWRKASAFTLIKSLVVIGILTLCLVPLRCGAAVTLTILHSFAELENDANPVSLLQASDGNFYGATSANSITTTNGPYGTIFRITPEGAFTNLHVFSGGKDGAWPQAGLAQNGDGNFYGTTYRRGVNDWGTFFKITPFGDFTTLASFDDFSGDASSLLAPASDGYFYTLGNHGGLLYLGTLFGLGTDGTVFVVGSFDGTNGFTGWYSNPLLDTQRCPLLAWCVMSNHVRALIETRAGWPLDAGLHSLKSFTSHEAGKIKAAGGTPALPGRERQRPAGEFWQRE